MIGSNFVKFLMSILKRQVNSSSIFLSFFIVMTHKSPVNFKLIHFLLWTKGSHESPNFDTFQCSGENFPNSSCHFPNHKLVFFQILHHSLVSWNITPLQFFRSNIKYFAQYEPIKVHILHHSSGPWDITSWYFFSWNFIYFQQKEPIKVQILWNFTWAVESLKILHFDGLLLSKLCTVSAKKVQKSYLMTL